MTYRGRSVIGGSADRASWLCGWWLFKHGRISIRTIGIISEEKRPITRANAKAKRWTAHTLTRHNEWTAVCTKIGLSMFTP